MARSSALALARPKLSTTSSVGTNSGVKRIIMEAPCRYQFTRASTYKTCNDLIHPGHLKGRCVSPKCAVIADVPNPKFAWPCSNLVSELRIPRDIGNYNARAVLVQKVP